MKEADIFSSFDEFLLALKLHELEHREQYWMRDCKTLKNANRLRSKFARPELKYYYVRYSCIHGGQEFRKKENRKKKSQGTWKQGCGADIRLKLSADCQALMVYKINSLHNHDLPSVETYKQFPLHRRSKHKVIPLVPEEFDTSRKLAPESTLNTSKILLKDLIDSETAQNEEKLFKFADYLQEKYDCTVDVNIKRNRFIGLFLQDKRMKENFKDFPEILFVDGTHKCLKLNLPLYVFAAENAMGQTDIVGVALLAAYSTANFNWTIDKFKERNEKWTDIRVLFLENDLTSSSNLQELFPRSNLVLCPDQYLRHFKDVTAKRFVLSDKEIALSTSYLRKILSARTFKKHRKIYEDFATVIPSRIQPHISSGWLSSRYDWLIKNNRLEGFYLKLRATITPNITLAELFNNFFHALQCKRTEYQDLITRTNYKIPITQYTDESEESFFARILTKHAFDHVEKQLNAINSIKCAVDEEGNAFCEEDSVRIQLTENSCECEFNTIIKLPCKHLFSYRKSLYLPTYDRSLCAVRWTRSYLDSSSNRPEKVKSTAVVNLGVEDKYRKAMALCSKLAQHCSQVSDRIFDERIEFLLSIEKQWRNQVELTSSDPYDLMSELEQFSPMTCDLYTNNEEYL